MWLIDIIGACAIILAILTVIANLVLGATYDLKPKHQATELPKAKSTSTQAKR